MRLVKVKRTQEEKNYGMLTLVVSCLHICEATSEGGTTTLDFYNIWNVTERWDLEAE